MPVTFRNAFYAGLLLTLVIGIYLFQLWRPERQVRLHTTHLLAAIEEKDWAGMAEFVDEGYQDQWGHDRALVLARIRAVLIYARNLRLEVVAPVITASRDEGDWSAQVTVAAEPNEVSAYIQERVNTLDTPFELHWRRIGKPWEWKLVRVSNTGLELPAGRF